MSWHFSQALVAAYSGENSSGGAPSVPSKSSPVLEPSLPPAKMTAASRLSRYGTMFAPLTEDRGAALLTWFQEASRVRTSVSPAVALGWTAPAQDCGRKCGESLAKLDPVTCSWRTRQHSLFEEECESLPTLPPWGMTVAGELYPLPTPSGLVELRASITSESGSGFGQRLPTPTRSQARSPGERLDGCGQRQLCVQVKRLPTPTVGGNYNRKGLSPQSGDGLATAVKRMPTPTVQDAKNNGAPSQMERNTKPLNAEVGGPLNPTWVEWLMGWPIGWTDLSASATANFQTWCASRGIS
jgi:hypothetical protein